MSDQATKIWNHIKSSTELLNLCYVPVNCFIVCATLSGCLRDARKETGTLPTTLTKLYQAAINHFEKFYRRNANRNFAAHEALDQLQRLAFFGIENGQLVFNQTLFDEEMKTSGLLNSLSNPILLLQTQFCFIHLTIQEFLAARHVIETFSPPEINKFISKHVKIGKWHLVLQFIAELLGEKIKNFEREYKDCVFAFGESLKVTDGKIEVQYHEAFIMKCLKEVDDEEIAKEVCEATALNNLVELLIYPSFFIYFLSDLEAVAFVCKHLINLANLKLIGLPKACLPLVLGLLRERCLKKLEMHVGNADTLDQVFSALMELDCKCNHYTHTELTSLTLRGFCVTETSLTTMCKFFENGHASPLEKLNLSSSGINIDQISRLCEVLNGGHCRNLTHLYLENNSTADKGAMELFDTLTNGLCKLDTLDVSENKLTDECIPTLVKTLQDERCQLTDLSLDNNAIGDEGVGMLFEDALTNKHCKLTKLNLGNSSLTDQCIPSLCKTLQDERCQLTDLSLRGNAIGDKSAVMLFEDALTNKHCKVTKLNLDKCSLTNQCISTMCKTLQDKRCPLTDLSLRGNAIGDEGAVMLFEDALRNKHRKLTKLNLGKCSLIDQCIPGLCKALQDERCQLTDLSLEGNAIGDEGAVMLFEDALTNKHCKLTKLNLDDCSLTDQCIPSLCKALKDDQCELTTLSFLLNRFTKSGVSLLRNAKNYAESYKAGNLQTEKPLDRDAVDKSYDTDTIKTSNTSEDTHLQDKTVDNVKQRVFETRIYECHKKANEILEAEILQKEAVNRKSSEFDEAFQSYFKDREIPNELDDDKEEEEANACLIRDDTFQELKQLEKAIESHQMALNISGELEDKEMQIDALQKLGKLYSLQSNFYKECDYDKAIGLRAKAIESYRKALDILGTKPNQYHHLRENILSGLEFASSNLKTTEKAMESIHEAQSVAGKTNKEYQYDDISPNLEDQDEIRQKKAHTNLGAVYHKSSELDEAVQSKATSQPEQAIPQTHKVTVNEQGQSVPFPAASAFFQFPAEAVATPMSFEFNCIRHQKCVVAPRNGDVFCSSIVEMTPKGYHFNKPVTVLLSHCAAQDGAYADYYELTIQKLGKEWKDLETEQLQKPEDLPEKTVSDFCDILEYLPLAQVSITEASTLVATTRIRSEEIILVPDEMHVYSKSYGNETDLEIIFPFGAVEEECHLTVQVFPVRDMLNASTSQLIQLPVLEVSGRDEKFLEPIEVVFGYSCSAVEELNEEFFPVNTNIPFTSKHGVLLRSHTNLRKNNTWENIQDDETAVIKRTRKDRLEISFCVYHFCKWCIALKKSADVSTEGVEHTCFCDQPDVRAVCAAPYETDSISGRKLSAVVAPLNKSKEVKTEWGLPGEILLLKEKVPIFYCVPLDENDHLELKDDNIEFYRDIVNFKYNRIECAESVLRNLDMRFLRTKCAENKHFGTDCLGKCPITPKKVPVTAVDERPATSSGTFVLPSPISCQRNDSSLSNVPSNAEDQVTEILKEKKERCEFFQNKMERFYKKIQELDNDKKESKASKALGFVNPGTSVLIGIGSVLAIVMSVPPVAIAAGIVGAGVAAVTLTVKTKDYLKNTKTKRNVYKLCEIDQASAVILTILKEVSIELSRIFEQQLFKLKDDEDVTTMASCAVNLMFKFEDGDTFDRNTLLRNVLCRKLTKGNPKVKMRNNQTVRAQDLFQKTGLRKVPRLVSSSSAIQFEYCIKGDDTCDPQTYGYRGEILQVICKTTNNESEARNIGCTEPVGGGYDTKNACCPIDTNEVKGEVIYFVECDIDKEYKIRNQEDTSYQPFHCLVRCPSILESLPSKASNSNRPSLKNVVSEMYHQEIRPVRPVYRPHSPRTVHSLSNTDLSNTDFSHVNFTSSSLENCDLSGCTILFGELKGASLCRSHFMKAYLSNCNLTDVKAQGCTWRITKVHDSCADYSDIDVVGSNSWKGTTFAKTPHKPSPSKETNQLEQAVPQKNHVPENELSTVSLASNCTNNNVAEREENAISTVLVAPDCKETRV